MIESIHQSIHESNCEERIADIGTGGYRRLVRRCSYVDRQPTREENNQETTL